MLIGLGAGVATFAAGKGIQEDPAVYVIGNETIYLAPAHKASVTVSPWLGRGGGALVSIRF